MRAPGGSPGELLRLGAEHLAQGRDKDALTVFRDGMASFPEEWRFAANAATVLYRLRQRSSALKVLNSAMKLAPGETFLHRKMASWLLELGKTEAALAVLERSLEASDDRETLLHLGSAYLECKQDGRAAKLAERAVQRYPDEADAHLLQAFVLAAQGEREASARCLERTLQHDPRAGQAYYHLARRGKYTDVAHLEGLLEDPEVTADSRHRLHFALGCIHDRAGRHGAAWAHFDEGNRLVRAGLPPWDADLNRRSMRLIAEVFTRAALEPRIDPQHAGAAPIFIIGMPRTGSSLLEQILDSHPRTHGVGEHSGGIARIAKQLTQVRPGVRLFPHGVLDLRTRDIEPLRRSYLDHLPGREGPLPEGLRPVDKLLANYQTLGLIARLFPDARILNCQRDIRDCGLSAYFIEFHRNELPWSYGLDSIARYYEDYVELMDHWRRHLPLPILDVPYEDLVREPEAWTRRVLEFCDLEWDEACLRYDQSQRPVFTASALQVREKPHTKAVARWKPYEDHLGPLLDLADDA